MTIYYGDNLKSLKMLKEESINLIYLDPPFNSQSDYKSVFTPAGMHASLQVFVDSWTWNEESEKILENLRMPILDGIKNTLGKTSLMAYLVMMTARLAEMYRVLKNTGSIYLHCDPSASHYLKVILDSIFGVGNFRAEIIWKRASSAQKGNQIGSAKPGRNHDVILFYAKSDKSKYETIKRQLSNIEMDKKFSKHDERGYYHDQAPVYCGARMKDSPTLCYEWRGFKNPYPSGWRLSKPRLEEEYNKGNICIVEKNGVKRVIRKVYRQDYDGENIGDLWNDINPARGSEKLGYPTQKPQELLERIIKMSSIEGDLVLDPFCGSGSTLKAAHRLGRKYIGMDRSILSIKMSEKLLSDSFGIRETIHGMPKNQQDAEELNDEEYSIWASTLVKNAVPAFSNSEHKGVGYVRIGKQNRTFLINAVKNCTESDIDKIKQEITAENHLFGIIVCINADIDDDEDMIKLPLGQEYKKINIYTVDQYFDGKLLDIPPTVDFTKAERAKSIDKSTQTTL